MTAAPSRNGFTLVELLVVTGLLASLLSLVIVAMRPNEDSQVRQTANALVSAIMQTRTRALSRAEGAALIIRRADSVRSTAVAYGDIQQSIRASVAAGMPPASLSSGSASITVTGSTMQNADDVSLGFQIRFSSGGPSSEWFAFRPTAPLAGEVTLQSSLGQSIFTTPWPSGSSLACEIARWPTETQSAVSFPKFAAIDLRFSSIGDDIADVVGMGVSGELPIFSPRLSLGRVSFCFDRTGNLTSFIPPQVDVKDPTSPVKPAAPIYLLIAANSDIDNTLGTTPNYNSLRSDKSIWIAISPVTGRVTTAKNVPSTKPDLSDLASQGKEVAIPIARERLRAYFRSVRSNVLVAP
jgi:prepilin-type N-terminal cleavage/methylation domain-containing protein